eukprot:7030720-Alexandrium_andersonii.AAC.1
MPWLTPGSPKRLCVLCPSQDDAVAGCSCRKWAPRSSWRGAVPQRTPGARRPCAPSQPPPLAP